MLAAREAAFLLLLVTAAFTDLAYAKVYNWLTLPAIALGLGLSYAAWGIVPGFEGPLDNILGCALGGGLFLIFFAKGWIGPGDAKLVAAIGALKGLTFVVYSIFLAACVGAVMAVGWFIWQGRFWDGLAGSLLLLVSPRRFKKRYTAPPTMMPYGLAISAGGLWAWVYLNRSLLFG